MKSLMVRFRVFVCMAAMGIAALWGEVARATDAVAPTTAEVAATVTNALYPALLALFLIGATVLLVFFTKDWLFSLVRRHKKA